MLIKLGQGRVDWERHERITDRYGTVLLMDTKDRALVFPRDNEGDYGRLIAEVIETRPSPHLGDWAHGFVPETPNVGEKITLGEGRLFFEIDEDDKNDHVGLTPKKKRNDFWLDPKALYRVHAQTVILYFEPAKKKGGD